MDGRWGEVVVMGRTNPTFRDTLRVLEDRWQVYRRALRRHDQSRFDRLFTYAREHADASGLLNHQHPLLPTLISIDLEQESRLDEHADRLAELEAALDSPQNDSDDESQEDAQILAEEM